MTAAFDYDNTSGRPTGPVMTVLQALLPGVRTVRRQIAPYAQQWAASNLAALGAEGPLWVALGDSMTQGIGASSFDRGWVGQLSERLREQGRPHRVVNLAVTGARVDDALERQVPALEALIAAGQVPDLVTVVLGSNDVVTPRHRAGLTDRFAHLLDRLPDGAVVLNLPNPHKEARRLDALLRERQAQGRLVLADVRRHGPRSWRGRLAPDRFHPNDRGYEDMAHVFELALDSRDQRRG
ncbi:SGNH/GDSL hydrolase family protein [Pedococcus sp. KACC 23699]|uniref:SGNH/GDSL hydrolase family protein n=1 Tax=Pedococcus sp. KACC 23699 TaxID=3149228 RepID=A0AAU7JRI4_9MICO